MYSDAHTHLDLRDFRTDVAQVIDRARANQVTRFLNVSSSPASIQEVTDLAFRFEGVFAGAGVHPHWASEVDDDLFARVKQALADEKVVVVGEIGLDYYRNLSPKEVQIRVFRKFLDLAREKDLPVVIHSRNALPDILDILEEYGASPWRGIMHCFSGDEEQLGRTLTAGLHVSFAGNITYKSGGRVNSLLRKVPERRLLIETDCPYLSPHPYRGKRNEPGRIPLIAEAVAPERRLFPEDVGRITTFNLLSLIAPAEVRFPPVIAYKIRDSLYLNITNRCTCSCSFCVRNDRDGISGYNLRLTREPEVEEILKAVASAEGYREIVFCGFGEPTIQLDTMVAAAGQLKEAGHSVRVNTNGLGNLYHGFDMTERLQGIVDAFTVSLNASDRESYSRICKPAMGSSAFDGVLDFIRAALARNFHVTVTTVEAPEVDVEGCRAIARSMGVDFRKRYFCPGNS